MNEERKLVAYRIPVSTDVELTKVAELLDRSKSSCVREALKDFIAKHADVEEKSAGDFIKSAKALGWFSGDQRAIL